MFTRSKIYLTFGFLICVTFFAQSSVKDKIQEQLRETKPYPNVIMFFFDKPNTSMKMRHLLFIAKST